jgi:hypothetical protein
VNAGDLYFVGGSPLLTLTNVSSGGMSVGSLSPITANITAPSLLGTATTSAANAMMFQFDPGAGSSGTLSFSLGFSIGSAIGGPRWVELWNAASNASIGSFDVTTRAVNLSIGTFGSPQLPILGISFRGNTGAAITAGAFAFAIDNISFTTALSPGTHINFGGTGTVPRLSVLKNGIPPSLTLDITNSGDTSGTFSASANQTSPNFGTSKLQLSAGTTTLGAGASTTLGVQLMNSSQAGTSIETVTLSGTGINPLTPPTMQIQTAVYDVPVITATGSLEFTSTGSAVSRNVTLANAAPNSGSEPRAPIVTGSGGITGADAALYSVASLAGGTAEIAGGGSLMRQITFTPTASLLNGTYTATFTQAGELGKGIFGETISSAFPWQRQTSLITSYSTNTTGSGTLTVSRGYNVESSKPGVALPAVNNQQAGASLQAGTIATNTSIGMSLQTPPAEPALPGNAVTPGGKVLSLSGTGSSVIVLQLTWTDADLGAISEALLDLYWLDPGLSGSTSDDVWRLAVEGNSGAPGALAGRYDASWSGFVASHGGVFNPITMLGAYGVDPASNSAWAVINHNSIFALSAVPEPGVCGVIGSMLLPAMLRRRRRGAPSAAQATASA